jgi:hypothetical protein
VSFQGKLGLLCLGPAGKATEFASLPLHTALDLMKGKHYFLKPTISFFFFFSSTED